MILQPLQPISGPSTRRVVVSVKMHGAEVDVGEGEDAREGLPGCSVIVEVPVVGAGAPVHIAVATEGDEVGGVEGFDVG